VLHEEDWESLVAAELDSPGSSFGDFNSLAKEGDGDDSGGGSSSLTLILGHPFNPPTDPPERTLTRLFQGLDACGRNLSLEFCDCNDENEDNNLWQSISMRCANIFDPWLMTNRASNLYQCARGATILQAFALSGSCPGIMALAVC